MIRKPQEWARAALPAYGLESCEFEMLRTLGDAVARVETPEGPRSLRVNLPGSGERQEEIHRFLALANAAGLHVPLPLPDLLGRTRHRQPAAGWKNRRAGVLGGG